MKIKKLLFLVLGFILTFSMVACQNNQETISKESVFTGKYIVDANYVKEHYEDDNIILVDARGEEAAKKGTIEGAVTTTWQNLSNIEGATKGDYDWGLILEPEVLSKKLGDLGLSKDKEIILFAEGPKGWGEDGRILWTLKAAGYENLKMVDGGLNALEAVGLNKSKDVKRLDPVEVEIDALDYEHVINTKELEVSYDDYIILDVREDKEYNGGVHYGEAKGGRLPGAIQVRFIDMFDSDGYLKSNDEINSMFEDANVKKTDKVVHYCTSGIRSAYTQLIMEMLDYEVTKNYEGSYNTWCVQNEVEND